VLWYCCQTAAAAFWKGTGGRWDAAAPFRDCSPCIVWPLNSPLQALQTLVDHSWERKIIDLSYQMWPVCLPLPVLTWTQSLLQDSGNLRAVIFCINWRFEIRISFLFFRTGRFLWMLTTDKQYAFHCLIVSPNTLPCIEWIYIWWFVHELKRYLIPTCMQWYGLSLSNVNHPLVCSVAVKSKLFKYSALHSQILKGSKMFGSEIIIRVQFPMSLMSPP